MPDEQFLQQMIANPHESLDTELKAWFDPRQPEGKAKIVRSALALRNHGGGFLLVGFDNATGSPVSVDCLADVRSAFHIDTIQALVTRFASQAFEVVVHFVMRGGQEHPVIEVPPGVKVPVATRSSLTSTDGTALIRDNRVYVRTLGSNNTPSSSEANWKDWARIVETCFENWEADIGRFVRRHLVGLSPSTVREIAVAIQEASRPPETTEEHARRLLDNGVQRFRQIVAEKQVTLPPHGAWETSVILLGDPIQQTANRSFLNLLLSSSPHYTGWPVWIDSRNFPDTQDRPYVYQSVWEAFVVSLGRGNFGSIDFWRLDPRGKFYQYRALQDDVAASERRPSPLTELDFALQVFRIAEAIAVGLVLARVLSAQPDEASAAFAFRWSRLNNRVLSSWANPDRGVLPGLQAHQDEVFSLIEIPLATSTTSLSRFVHNATAPLFAAFAGHEISESVTEEITRRLVERRL
jgi:hypothetical protein